MLQLTGIVFFGLLFLGSLALFFGMLMHAAALPILAGLLGLDALVEVARVRDALDLLERGGQPDQQRVGAEPHGVDAKAHQEFRHLRVVAGRLAAEAGMAAVAPATVPASRIHVHVNRSRLNV